MQEMVLGECDLDINDMRTKIMMVYMLGYG